MTRKLIKIGAWLVLIIIVAPDAMSAALTLTTQGLGNLIGGGATMLGDMAGHEVFGGTWSWIKHLF